MILSTRHEERTLKILHLPASEDGRSDGSAPETIFAEIKKFKPEFEMEYEVDPLKQSIADSWPDRLDDSAAREEWDWQPKFDITAMTQDMLEQLSFRMC